MLELDFIQKVCVVISLGSVGLLLSIIVVPFLNDYGTLVGLDGSINVIDNEKIFSSLDAFSYISYTIGDLTCHQIESRTFILNGNEMPICIRDFSLFSGFVSGMIICCFKRFQFNYKVLMTILFCIVLSPLEWYLEHISDIDYVTLRVLSSVITGISFAIGVQIFLSLEIEILKRLRSKKHDKKNRCTNQSLGQ